MVAVVNISLHPGQPVWGYLSSQCNSIIHYKIFSTQALESFPLWKSALTHYLWGLFGWFELYTTVHVALPYTAFLCAFLQKYRIKYKCIIYPEIELEMVIKDVLLQLPVEIE